MSQPVSRFLHPFDGAEHPAFEPEVERALITRCAFAQLDSAPHRVEWTRNDVTIGGMAA